MGPSDMLSAPTMQSVPSQVYEGLPSATEDVGGVGEQSREIVKGARVTFKESAHVLQRIVEFMYLGEIAALEEGSSATSEDDYNLWMWLLTWYEGAAATHEGLDSAGWHLRAHGAMRDVCECHAGLSSTRCLICSSTS
jgi:hypothetical protein